MATLLMCYPIHRQVFLSSASLTFLEFSFLLITLILILALEVGKEHPRLILNFRNI